MKTTDHLTDIFDKNKTKRKMNLISENMLRDRQNLNNPNEFYADLFSSFVVKNRKTKTKGRSNIQIIKVPYYNEESS